MENSQISRSVGDLSSAKNSNPVEGFPKFEDIDFDDDDDSSGGQN